MRSEFTHINESLNRRLIISHAELKNSFDDIFPNIPFTYEETSLPLENFSNDELKVVRRLLDIFRKIEKPKISSRLLVESKIISNRSGIDASHLCDSLWVSILEYLSLQERAKIIHLSRMWHQLTQSSCLTEIIIPFQSINDQLGMSYLLIYNFRKECPSLSIKDLRKKMQVIVKNSYAKENEFQRMLRLSFYNDKSFTNFIKFVIRVFCFFGLLLVVNNILRNIYKENFYLDISVLAIVFGGLGLNFLLAPYSNQNRIARKIERISEKGVGFFLPSGQSVQNLKDNLKENVIPPFISDGIYSWKHSEYKTLTKQTQVNPFKNQTLTNLVSNPLAS